MINKLLDYAKKENLELEVFTTRKEETDIEFLNEQMTNYKTQDIKEYNIKALIDGATVTATLLDISNPKEVVEMLKMARELTDELDSDSLAERIDICADDRTIQSRESSNLKRDILSFNQELKDKFPEIYSIRTEYTQEKTTYELFNTNDLKISDINYWSGYSTDIVLKIDDKNLNCYKCLVAKNPDFVIFKNKVQSAIINELKKRNATSVATNKYNIILDNESVYDILNAFALDFHAKNIQTKQSVFMDKLGQKIFSDKMTITEDPTNKDLVGTRLFDGEGTKTYRKKVVENGIFTTELYNKKYAEKDSKKSTGNSYGVRNLYIEPGLCSQSELLSKLNDGIYVEHLMGLHNGINHLTGDISIQCDGFLVENGEKTIPLKQIVLSTNILELFKNVSEIGNDLEFFGSNGGAPSLLIENITIAGKEV